MGNQLRDALKKMKLAKKPKHVPPARPEPVARVPLTGKRRIPTNPPPARSPEDARRRAEQDKKDREKADRKGRQQGQTAAELGKVKRMDSALGEVFGGGKGSGPKPPAAAPVPGQPTIEKSGSFAPHPLFSPKGDVVSSRRMPRHDGIAKQLTSAPSDESDLVLGLDFGTSSTKAVIRDQTGGRAYSVKFAGGIGSEFLLLSRVFRTGGRYSLDGGQDSIRDLKLRLLNAGAASPVDEFNDACGFLALAIRHCRGWLLDEFAPRYRNHRLNWQVNLGLAARSYEERQKARLFRRLAWAAASCAASSNETIDEDLVDRFREQSGGLFREGTKAPTIAAEFQPDDVDVVPEIAAQISGFVESSRWDWRRRPMMMVVDVGAGTVDSALFSVGREGSGQLQFAFFADEVLQNGVMNLHRTRVAWLRKCMASAGVVDVPAMKYLDAIEIPTDRTAAIPESAVDYIPGYRISMPDGALGIDDDFRRHRYRPQVFACIRQARLQMGVPDSQLTQLPFFLCGGGSRMNLYRGIAEAITRAPINVTTETQRMHMPADLHPPGLDPGDFDRLSVAYGLSRRAPDGGPLGKYVRSMDIPKVLSRAKFDYEANFIDGSMV